MLLKYWYFLLISFSLLSIGCNDKPVPVKTEVKKTLIAPFLEEKQAPVKDPASNLQFSQLSEIGFTEALAIAEIDRQSIGQKDKIKSLSPGFWPGFPTKYPMGALMPYMKDSLYKPLINNNIEAMRLLQLDVWVPWENMTQIGKAGQMRPFEKYLIEKSNQNHKLVFAPIEISSRVPLSYYHEIAAVLVDAGIGGFVVKMEDDSLSVIKTKSFLMDYLRDSLYYGGILVSDACNTIENYRALGFDAIEGQTPQTIVARLHLAKAWLEKSYTQIEEQKEDEVPTAAASLLARDKQEKSDICDAIETYQTFLINRNWKAIFNDGVRKSSVEIGEEPHFLPLTDLREKQVHLVVSDVTKYWALAKQLSAYFQIQTYKITDKEWQAKMAAKRKEDYWILVEPHLWSVALPSFRKEQTLAVHFGATPIQKGNYHWLWMPSETDWGQNVLAQCVFGGRTVAYKAPSFLETPSPNNQSKAIRLAFDRPESVGIASEKMVNMDAIARQGIAAKCYPGCQVLVIKEGTVVWEKTYGDYTYESDQQVQEGSIYDIASLTKIMATTPAIMYLYENEKVFLKDNMEQLLPFEKRSTIKNITLEQLLTHTSGLQPTLPHSRFIYPSNKTYKQEAKRMYSKYKHNPYTIQVADYMFMNKYYQDTIWNLVNTLPIGSRGYRYSDINFYLLHRLFEKTANIKMDTWVRGYMYDRMGLKTLGYKPLERFAKSSIIPTEKDNIWRKQLLQGYVHDHTIALLGGVGGSAGIFGTARDVGTMMQMFLNGGSYGGIQFFTNQTVDEFTGKSRLNFRGLGFDKPSGSSYQAISYKAAASTFGHTGFTGGCTWADPKNDLIFVFLSNRIYPNSNYKNLWRTKVRERLHTSLYDALGSFLTEIPILEEG